MLIPQCGRSILVLFFGYQVRRFFAEFTLNEMTKALLSHAGIRMTANGLREGSEEREWPF
jgi:hypothetical protein